LGPLARESSCIISVEWTKSRFQNDRRCSVPGDKTFSVYGCVSFSLIT